MEVYRNISLRPFNTFGLDVSARTLIIIKNHDDANNLFRHKNVSNANCLVTGRGSNILYLSDFEGTIIISGIEGIETERKENQFVLVKAGAGVIWDKFVEWCVERNLAGIERLSYIPGTVGAAPVQNIGAYGSEAKDAVVNVEAVSLLDGSIKNFSNEECRFGYRDSIFKKEEKGKWLVTGVSFRFNTEPDFTCIYNSVAEEVDRLGGLSLTNIRKAVINIRKNKLPDPEITGNGGSFFKNPVIKREDAEILKERFPDMPLYSESATYTKIPAAWLIEKCGWKGKRYGGAGVWERQPLVIVNLGNATGMEIFKLSEMIKKSVFEKFGIELEREVEVIGKEFLL
ncbi:MAG TPA: UDP-N-acetylmuramate dehydrogenase [Bacteroidales bacterium]|nr:UDP-N-acetylmuramate dehydrogenase [Bacteroidales bacterium]HCI55634.1 hypothetical protein [Bacteroidales bacterium]HRC90112.1 UDP-N-acetylmuramate dehydrogenase [Bacteroidales bacterium]